MCFYNDDGYADIHEDIERKARKYHPCCECRDPIEPGELYKATSWLSDGQWTNVKTCRRCQFDLRRIFKLEQSRGCAWSNSFPNVWELHEALSEEGMERTPKDEVPADFPVMWTREAWTEKCRKHELDRL